MSHKRFPDFFTTKGPVPTEVVPLRINNTAYWVSRLVGDTATPFESSLRAYDDNEEGLLDCWEVEESYDIRLTKSGKFVTAFYVPTKLLSYIIGPKGVKLKNLQKNTRTLIKVPKMNERGDVKVTGDTERGVASALTQIIMTVMECKEKLSITHFVSIPVNTQLVIKNFKLFQEQVLELKLKDVTPELFQRAEKLHVTVCTLTLVDDLEVETAKKVLNNCCNSLRLERNLLTLKGLEIMNDDPIEARVLYCKVEDNKGTLQGVADSISECFYKASLAKKQYDRVKLHVTLMNANFGGENRIRSFDATDILSRFSNYELGSVEFDNIQLSVRFSSGNDNYYECALKINCL